jgi:hypothetical protein
MIMQRKTYFRLKILGDAGRDRNDHALVRCVCACAPKKVIVRRRDAIEKGYAKSCGCLRRQIAVIRCRRVAQPWRP